MLPQNGPGFCGQVRGWHSCSLANQHGMHSMNELAESREGLPGAAASWVAGIQSIQGGTLDLMALPLD